MPPARKERARTLARYTLFQIPDLVLLGLALALAVRWWELPVRIAWLIIGLWVVKDIVMYPFMRVAYQSDPGQFDRLADARGVAIDTLDPRGYVRVGSERWRAELTPGTGPIPSGEPVRVVEVRGFTLRVEPDGGAP